VIDVRDLAGFTRKVIENSIGGIFNLSGPRLTWAEFMHILSPERIVWVSAEIIAAAGLTFVELPLFRPEYGARSSLMDVSNNRARAKGLSLTPPEVSVSDMRVWLQGKDAPLALSLEREAELIRTVRQHTT
jgi:2'-hydroxyisoflavone reductase